MTTTDTRVAMTDLAQILVFVRSGHALFTVQNTATGNHFTYLVSYQNSAGLGWVTVLTGNDGQYQYVGLIGRNGQFRWTRASKFSFESPSVQVIGRLINHWIPEGFPPTVRFLHHGLCGKCGRLLTEPESIARGIGPICAEKS
jgi:hypothetical protein